MGCTLQALFWSDQSRDATSELLRSFPLGCIIFRCKNAVPLTPRFWPGAVEIRIFKFRWDWQNDPRLHFCDRFRLNIQKKKFLKIFQEKDAAAKLPIIFHSSSTASVSHHSLNNWYTMIFLSQLFVFSAMWYAYMN